MTKSGEIAVVYHGHTFLELAGAGSTVFLDPVFSSARRGRRQRGETRKADYVFVSRESDVLEDALDVLEDSDAILVASDGICRYATQELDLGRGRTLDLEPWERANDEAFRVTAVPLTAPSLVDDGTALLDGLTGGLGEGVSSLPRSMGTMPVVGALLGSLGSVLSGGNARGMARRGFGQLSELGAPLTRGLRGRPSLGWVFELTAGQKLCFLGDGVHAGTDDRDLEDIASLADVDVLALDVGSHGVESVVRAARVFGASTVLLYRSRDAYARGRRAQALPVSAFLEAINEDRGDEVDALHLRPGDRFVLSAPEPTAPVKPAGAPATPASAGKASLATVAAREGPASPGRRALSFPRFLQRGSAGSGPASVQR